MKDYIRQLVDGKASYNANTNRMREYLQEYFLYTLYKKKIYKDFVFCGGTALRFLHKTKRFSEDIDFSLSYKIKQCDFETVLKIVKKEFTAAGYFVEVNYRTVTNVYSAFLKFPGLLFEYGVSPHKDEKISIKVEIDVNPPHGGKEQVTLYNGIFIFYTIHYDLASLLAGKLSALLCRNYTKGRDWYDLLWYLTKFKNLEPNFVMLNNAMRQAHRGAAEITVDNWRSRLKTAVDVLDMGLVRKDVYRFLETPEEGNLVTKENFYNALGTK
jgi:predicted nucleotidyltransferase component of viral defense system